MEKKKIIGFAIVVIIVVLLVAIVFSGVFEEIKTKQKEQQVNPDISKFYGTWRSENYSSDSLTINFHKFYENGTYDWNGSTYKLDYTGNASAQYKWNLNNHMLVISPLNMPEGQTAPIFYTEYMFSNNDKELTLTYETGSIENLIKQ